MQHQKAPIGTQSKQFDSKFMSKVKCFLFFSLHFQQYFTIISGRIVSVHASRCDEALNNQLNCPQAFFDRILMKNKLDEQFPVNFSKMLY